MFDMLDALKSTVRISDGTLSCLQSASFISTDRKNELTFFELQQGPGPIRIQNSVVQADSFKILPPIPKRLSVESRFFVFDKVA